MTMAQAEGATSARSHDHPSDNALLRGRPNFLVSAGEGGFLNPVGVLRVLGVLHDRIAGSRNHRLAPGRREGELAVLFGHHHEAHIRTARPIWTPAVFACGSGRP